MQKNVCKEENARDRRDNHKQAHKYAAFNRQCRFLFSYFKCPHPWVSTKNRSDMADITVSVIKVVPARSCCLCLTDSSLTCLLFFFFLSSVTTKCITCFVLRVLLEPKCTQARNNFPDDITRCRLNARPLWWAWNLICAACEPCSDAWCWQGCSAPDLILSQSPGCDYVFLCAPSQG